MLKAVILDDEVRGSRLLGQKLKSFEADVQVVAVFNHPDQAIEKINGLQADVLFLDVEMPSLNGFQFLERLGSFNFEVVFVTAYDSYILDALRVSAVDYLLKPVDEEELGLAIGRLKKRITGKQQLSPQMQDKFLFKGRLALPTAEGIYLISKETISRVEAMSNYSAFHTTDNKKIVVSRTLKEYESLLEGGPFVRVNRSTIVNLQFVTKYRRGEGGTLEMADGKEIEVSANRKEILLQKLFS